MTVVTCSVLQQQNNISNTDRTSNAGLELTADVLEEIYYNPSFPRWIHVYHVSRHTRVT